jgi:hypothetical protein
MSVNFFNNACVMAGVEMHEFVHLAPTPKGEVEIPLFPYFVGLPFWWPIATFWNRTGKVTADTFQMMNVSFSLLFVIHINLGGVPGPGQPYNLFKIVGTSGSEASLGIGSVTGEGEPLAACLAGPVGLNLNCWKVGDQPTGVVFSPCSVKTTPTALDYALAGLKWLSVGFLGEYVGKLVGKKLGQVMVKLAKILAKIPEAIWDFVIKQIVVNLIEKVAVLVRWTMRKLGY